MNAVLIGVLVAMGLKLAVQLSLQVLNRREAKRQRDQVPEHMKAVVTPEAHARSADYTLEHNALGIAQTCFGVLVKVGVLTCGILPLVYDWVTGNWGSQNVWALALMMVVWGLVISIVFWPWEWAGTFGVEAKYGFNRQTPWGWVSDQVKEWGVTLVLSVPLTALVLWMAGGAWPQWWLWAFLILLIYEVVLTYLYPNVIEPMFNKFEPLPQGALRERLEALAKKAGVKVGKISVMDASRRTAHANAYFAGVGGSRRIVLYDTLLKQLNDEEVAAVLAHEIGHMKHQHTLRGMYVSGAWQLVGLCILNAVIHWPEFYRAFGFDPGWVGVAAAVWLASMVGGAFSFWLRPMMSQWSRAHEYEADAYAARMMGSPWPLITGLKKLTKESLGSVEDHPWSHSFYASHPTLKERQERMLKEAKAV